MGKKRDTEQNKNSLEGQKGLSRREFFKKGAALGVGAAALAGLSNSAAQGSAAAAGQINWDYEADIVILGAGAVGLSSAIRARDAGASVLVIDQNFDVGGKMLHSAGRISLGGGDAIQRRDAAGEFDPDGFVTIPPLEPPEALEDDPEFLFRDMTDWSVMDVGGIARYRYNDPNLHRAWADNTVAVRDFLMENYLRFSRMNGTHPGGGVSRSRRTNAIFKIADVTDVTAGTITQADAGVDNEFSSHFAPSIMADMTNEAGPGIVRNGTAVARPLEFSAREKGVEFMLNRYMEEIIREQPFSGRVLGVRASYTPRHDPETGVRLESYWQNGNIDERRESVYIRARKAVIIGTGGHNNNPAFRSMFWPALANPFVVPAAFTLLGERGANASGMIAAMRIGATLAGMQQMTDYPSFGPRIATVLATRDAYSVFMPGHPAYAFRGSAGVNIGGGGFQHLIAVNQVGQRFYNETDLARAVSHPTHPAGPTTGTRPWQEHVQRDWRNASPEWVKANYNKPPGVPATLQLNEGSQHPDYLPGPTWAIFDQAALERTNWNINPPYTGDNGYFFKADTIEELAEMIYQGNEFQRVPLTYLRETVDKWNAVVEAGVDEEFERTNGLNKIETAPFYAASIIISWLDSYGGIRINGRAQVIDTQGQVIPSLYAGGEASGGGEQHGLGRALVHGYLAGTNAVQEPSA